MGSLLASALAVCGLRSVRTAVRALDGERDHGSTLFGRGLRKGAADEAVAALSAAIKGDLRTRFERGERPTAAEYLARHPALQAHRDRVVSLIYEEFCLLEEGGARPDVASFCARYPDWQDSLISQLGYHSLFSQLANPAGAAPRFPEPGESFEEFQLESLLGEGGAGRVFLARDQSLGGRAVALKISLDRGNEPSILARLDHLHIMPVHSVVFETGGPLRGLCMPYRPGLTLDKVIGLVHVPAPGPRRAQVFRDVIAAAPDPEGAGWDGFPASGGFADGVAWIGARLARALAHAHERGILHRDVKPANVLMTRRDGPQLLDFNLAHDPHSAGQAQVALQGGTLPYMAPEQLEAFLDPSCWGRVGAPADLYSLGLLLREMLTGQRPELPDPNLPPPRAIRSLLDLRASAPARLVAPVPGGLAAIVARCLTYAPADRYPDAAALADDLERFLNRLPLRHASNPSRRERLVNWTVRRGRRLALGAVAFAALAAVLWGAASRFMPLDRQPAFLKGVALVDANRGGEARALLEPLRATFPDSPVLGLYLSIALLQQDRSDEARAQFARAVADPDAEASLLRWGRGRPSVAEHLEALGTNLLLARSRDGTLAARAFRVALRLDPRLRAARQGMAVTLEYGRNYQQAHALISGLIRELESARTTRGDLFLVNSYRTRARIAIKWSEERLRKAADFEAAERLDREALTDSERWYSLLSARAQAANAYAYGASLAEATIGLGDVAGGRGDPARARPL